MDKSDSILPSTIETRHIQRLPASVIERIAAGEVIERPASVVRELMDNALDAGAHAIRVELRHGGLRLIRVADDGCGITPDDLPLACESHTTSKITGLADLVRISTLGFRGEALASIAAVASIELLSTCGDGGLARSITIGPERLVEAGATARSRGTTVTVRDLFATVPARHAMLHGPRTEAARISTLVRAYALSHPDTRFSLVADQQFVLQTHGAGLHAAVAALYGTDIERALLPIGPLEVHGAHIEGIIAGHGFSHPTRDHIVLAINHRPVLHRALLSALEAGYRPLLRKGRHPVLILRVTVAPEQVDSNVHPAKAEVLLRDEAAIATALREATHRALGSVPRGATVSTHGTAAPRSHPVQLRLPLARKRRGLLLGEHRHPYSITPVEAHSEESRTAVPPLEALAQFDNMLILARAADEHLYLVDQHRAHERSLYEQLTQTRGTATPQGLNAVEADQRDTEAIARSSQLLLEPILVELTPRQTSLLLPRLDELATLGMECQPFGGSVFLVRSMPVLPGAAQSPSAFAHALTEDAALESEDWFDAVCVSLACRSAFRRGQPLTPHQQQTLLDGLSRVTAPAICPHGSPLILRYTRSYLTRAFEW